MKRLTGLDATFLHIETSSQFGHVAGLSIFARPDVPDYQPYAAWRAQLEQRLHLLEPLRRRLAEVPFGLDHPFWIEDPDFDLDFHVRHAALSQSGSDHELASLVAQLISRPLDRRRPLWLSYVIEGLSDERFATLTIVHHATVDGASGVELLTLMLESDPNSSPPAPPHDDWTPDTAPTELQMLTRAAVSLVRKPGRAILLAARTAREIGTATRNPVLTAAANQVRQSLRGPLGSALNLGRRRPDERDTLMPLPSLRPPRVPFNAPITPHRNFVFGSTCLATIKEIKSRAGRHRQRRRHGGVRGWVADLARSSWRPTQR